MVSRPRSKSTIREPKDKESSDLRGSAGQIEQMAKDASIDVVAGYSEVLNKYPMMNKVDTIRTKLVFNRDNRKIVGVSVLRKCVPAQGSPYKRYLTLTQSISVWK
jgi:hypothetical protein